ncbi:MAG: type II toxin-antitoxin system RelE/ParE family toxin [Chitinispirillaceae bacterium]|nr:type II toxin-antitoxin system RelE/ParE family toxin [Chitinispirillaceae bacterium]
MRYSFHPEAQRELDGAIDYYESCAPGLGLEFAEETYGAIQRILLFPKAWTSLSFQTRRCLVNRFPFGVIYSIDGDETIILAVMQLNRKPGYWHARV